MSRNGWHKVGTAALHQSNWGGSMMIANSTSKSWHNKPTKTGSHESFKGEPQGKQEPSSCFPMGHDLYGECWIPISLLLPKKQCQVKFLNKMLSTVFTLVFTPKKNNWYTFWWVQEKHIWLVVSTPLKNTSQLGLLFHIWWKIKFMFQTTSQTSYFSVTPNLIISRKPTSQVLPKPLAPWASCPSWPVHHRGLIPPR